MAIGEVQHDTTIQNLPLAVSALKYVYVSAIYVLDNTRLFWNMESRKVGFYIGPVKATRNPVFKLLD